MPIAPGNALTKKLKWKDFPPQDRAEPEPGQFVQAALTSPGVGYGATEVNEVGNSDPPIYQLKAVPTITLQWPGGSWRAKFISKWPKKNQDDLLDHEQIHYLIVALSARDCENELQAIKKKTYADSGDGETDIEEALELLDTEAIHIKYDTDTQSLPTDFPVKQAAWAKAVRDAEKNKTPLRKTLKNAGLLLPEGGDEEESSDEDL